MSSWPDRAIAELAARQAANLSGAQLRALDVSASQIKRAAARGRLHRVHHGVYSIAPLGARPPLAAEHAAILATGPRAVLSHVTAARLHGLEPRDRDRRVHLTVVATHRHGRAGLVVHRTAVLADADHHRVLGLPVTSVARTVLDLAAGLSAPELAAQLDRALKRTSAAKLRAAIDRHRTRPGAPRLAELLDPGRPSADAWSAAEAFLLELIRRAGLPLPEVNVAVGRYVPDLVWRAQRVIVEYDSRAHHSGPAAVRWDAVRHNELESMHGYRVIHITWDELSGHPERLLAQIAVALHGGGR